MAQATGKIARPKDREIIDQPVAGELFKCPVLFSRGDEVVWAKVRQDASRIASYQDSHCGSFPNTFDPTGAYLCSGCNKLAPKNECLIRIDPIKTPDRASCGYWEIKNAGDMEVRYSPHGKLDDARIAFGTTPNPKGFGCERCEYGQQMLKNSDSEGRKRWCALKGMPVENKACCADNEPSEE